MEVGLEFLIAHKTGVTYFTAKRIAYLISYGYDAITVALLIGGVAGFVVRMIFVYVKRKLADWTIRRIAWF